MIFRYQKELVLIRANELLQALGDLKEFAELTEADRERVDSLIATITKFQVGGIA